MDRELYLEHFIDRLEEKGIDRNDIVIAVLEVHHL